MFFCAEKSILPELTIRAARRGLSVLLHRETSLGVMVDFVGIHKVPHIFKGAWDSAEQALAAAAGGAHAASWVDACATVIAFCACCPREMLREQPLKN